MVIFHGYVKLPEGTTGLPWRQMVPRPGEQVVDSGDYHGLSHLKSRVWP